MKIERLKEDFKVFKGENLIIKTKTQGKEFVKAVKYGLIGWRLNSS